MNKQYALLLLVLVGLSGCGKKKNKSLKRTQKNSTQLFSEVDIPVADEVLHKILDEDDVREFKIGDLNEQEIAATFDQIEDSWIEDVKQSDAFKAVLFDFDKSTPRQDQEKVINEDIKVAKRILDDAKLLNDEAASTKKIKISGHACHSAGSRAYNLALSEKRAKALADRLIAANVPSEDIKIVGCGMELPAIVNGKHVDGSREQQAPNRRDEISIIYS